MTEPSSPSPSTSAEPIEILPADAPAGRIRWRALTTHARVLVLLDERSDARLRDIAYELGLSERFVVDVLDDLERDGYITRHRSGRRNRYAVRRDLPLPDDRVRVTVAELRSGSTPH
jgi:predicted transcriptional regulator